MVWYVAVDVPPPPHLELGQAVEIFVIAYILNLLALFRLQECGHSSESSSPNTGIPKCNSDVVNDTSDTCF